MGIEITPTREAAVVLDDAPGGGPQQLTSLCKATRPPLRAIRYLIFHATRKEAAGMSEYVSTFEASRILGCAPDTIRWMARSGKLRAAIVTKAGRLFKRADIEQLALQRQEPLAVHATA
jgi:hypothetical protein